jgi:hypothetical protein
MWGPGLSLSYGFCQVRTERTVTNEQHTALSARRWTNSREETHLRFLACNIGQLLSPAGKLGPLALRAAAGVHFVSAGLAGTGLVRGRKGADEIHGWLAHDAMVAPEGSDRIGDIPASRP